MTIKQKTMQWLAGILLTVGGFLMVLPFLWMILSAFKPEPEFARFPPTLWPETFTLEHYVELFERMNFGVYLRNTLIIVFFSFLGMLLNAMAGYGFAKYKFKGREPLFYLVLATLMIPGQVTMIPVYLILNKMGLTNTMTGIVLPSLVGAFAIFLFRQFMSTIPDELLEATRLDGAGEFRIFLQIVLPISVSVLAVQGILTFIAGWNSFLWPLIIANDAKYYTLSAVMVVPIIIVFLLFQRYIMDNYTISGIK